MMPSYSPPQSPCLPVHKHIEKPSKRPRLFYSDSEDEDEQVPAAQSTTLTTGSLPHSVVQEAFNRADILAQKLIDLERAKITTHEAETARLKAEADLQAIRARVLELENQRISSQTSALGRLASGPTAFPQYPPGQYLPAQYPVSQYQPTYNNPHGHQGAMAPIWPGTPMYAPVVPYYNSPDTYQPISGGDGPSCNGFNYSNDTNDTNPYPAHHHESYKPSHAMVDLIIERNLPTNAERRAQRLAANDALRDFNAAELEGITHFKALKRPTLNTHEAIKQFWAEYVDESGDPELVGSRIIERGKPTPSEKHCKGFIRFLATSLEGRLGAMPTFSCIQRYTFTFSAIWQRYAVNPIPPDIKLQMQAYLQSDGFKETVKLVTAERRKTVAQAADVSIFLRALWEDGSFFNTLREKLECAFTIQVIAYTSERPGALIESTCYRGSGEALYYGDVEFHLCVLAKGVTFAIKVTPQLVKGHRDDDSTFHSTIMVAEPSTTRALCPVTLAFVFALCDGVFQDVSTAEEIFNPNHAPTSSHILRIKPEFAKVPIVRASIHTPDGWATSPTSPLKYARFHSMFVQVSARAGFKQHLRPYDLRRGAANTFDHKLSESERRLLMGHNTNSVIFQSNYQSTTSTIDVQSVFLDRPQDNHVHKATTLMSLGLDANAPTKISLKERQEILLHPVMLEVEKERQELLAETKQMQAVLVTLEDDENDSQESLGLAIKIKNLKADVARLSLQRLNIYSRAASRRLKTSREEYFAEHSKRQLLGKTIDLPANMAASSATLHSSNAREPGAPPLPSEVTLHNSHFHRTTSPLEDLLAVVYPAEHPSESDGEEPVEDTCQWLGASIGKAILTLMSLPEQRQTVCYPNEHPDNKGCCPVCGVHLAETSVKRSRGLGCHIHKCIVDAEQIAAQTDLEDSYQPQRCFWLHCVHSTTVWTTRATFVAHVHAHIESLAKPATRGGSIRQCSWEGCGETKAEDWEQHFAEVHGLNVHLRAIVEYCIPCAKWCHDTLGYEWAIHCEEHFSQFFAPFSERTSASAMHTHEGITMFKDAIEYELGTGFGGKQPEFHGHVVRYVALAPMFCIWCVFDQELNICIRMKQRTDPSDFASHLRCHVDALEPSAKHECPAPSCGTEMFTKHDLLHHLVCQHRLPVCGSTNHSVVRRLKLPNDATTNDDATTNTGAAPAIPAPTASRSSGQTLKKVVRVAEKKERVWWCYGCSRSIHDIDAHMINAGPTHHCYKNARVAQCKDNQPIPDTKTTWTPPQDPEAVKKRIKSFGNHKCGTCRRQFEDIRTHLGREDSVCRSRTFKIRDPQEKRRDVFGPSYNFEEWSKNCDNPSMGQMEPPTVSKKTKSTRDTKEAKYKCQGCRQSYVDIAAHFAKIRKPTSKCAQKVFSIKGDDGKWNGPSIDYATWVLDPSARREHSQRRDPSTSDVGITSTASTSRLPAPSTSMTATAPSYSPTPNIISTPSMHAAPSSNSVPSSMHTSAPCPGTPSPNVSALQLLSTSEPSFAINDIVQEMAALPASPRIAFRAPAPPTACTSTTNNFSPVSQFLAHTSALLRAAHISGENAVQNLSRVIDFMGDYRGDLDEARGIV
ncbi:hypothetical protein HYDPIDRAFT_37908 [Hydnomerulius pinastri MD-312]|nr:hypothetical protein HYDPIDRAFT_37908 [Hydnomerulius pinastri MD-312]